LPGRFLGKLFDGILGDQAPAADEFDRQFSRSDQIPDCSFRDVQQECGLLLREK